LGFGIGMGVGAGGGGEQGGGSWGRRVFVVRVCIRNVYVHA
jgi:hypothetical protein